MASTIINRFIIAAIDCAVLIINAGLSESASEHVRDVFLANWYGRCSSDDMIASSEVIAKWSSTRLHEPDEWIRREGFPVHPSQSPVLLRPSSP